MNRIGIQSLMIVLIVMGAFRLAGAQNADERQMLRSFSQEKNTEWQQNRMEVLEFVERTGAPMRREFQDGRVIQLVKFENGHPVYIQSDNQTAAETSSIDAIRPNGDLGFDLTGETQTLGIWDTGATRTTHQEFGDRATQTDGAENLTDHATHVAGTMVAAGVETEAQGMAYKAELSAHNWDDDLSEMAEAAANGVLVTNHSYGLLAGWSHDSDDDEWTWHGDTRVSEEVDYNFGFYSNLSQSWDELTNKSKKTLIVKSAGNDHHNGPDAQPVEHRVWDYEEGDYTTSEEVRELDGKQTGQTLRGRGIAKNVLSVGAVQPIEGGYQQPEDVNIGSFSSRGGADDGRIKPEIVAQGKQVYSTRSNADDDYVTFQGTSMSTPVVSGTVGLIHELYQQHYDDNPLSSTIRALLLHTVDEAGLNKGPDYKFGWGLLNGERAAKTLNDAALENNGSIIKEEELQNQDTFERKISSDGEAPLKVTLAWIDPAGEPVDAELNPDDIMLVNDLDVRVTGPNGEEHEPFVLDPDYREGPATTGDNTVDNTEQVLIEEPAEGDYLVEVTHKDNLEDGSQNFSLIITGDTGGPNEVATIAELIEDDQQGEAYHLTGEVVVTHIDRGENNQHYVADESGAILIDDPEEVLANEFETGAGMTNLVAEFNSSEETRVLIPEESPGVSSSDNELPVTEVELADLSSEDHQSMLVEIQDAEFIYEGEFAAETSYDLIDPTVDQEDAATFTTHQFTDGLDYLGDEVPSEPFGLHAIVTDSEGSAELTARSWDDFDYEPAEEEEYIEVATIAELIEDDQQGEAYHLTGEVVVTHIDRGENNQHYVADESGAILIDDPEELLADEFETGAGMTDLVAEFNSSEHTRVLIPEESPGVSSSDNELPVTEVELADLSSDEHQSMLVEIQDAEFVYDGEFAAETNYDLIDPTVDQEAAATFTTHNFTDDLDYLGEEVPSEPFGLHAMVTDSDGSAELTARSWDDFDYEPAEEEEYIEVATIAELIEDDQQGEAYHLTGEVVVTHIDRGENNQHYVADESGAILIDDPEEELADEFETGAGMTDLVAEFNSSEETRVLIPEESPGVSSSDNELPVTEVELVDLSSDEHQSMLVEIQDAEFVFGGEFEPETDYDLIDPSVDIDDAATFTTHNFTDELDYIGDAIPEGLLDLTALVIDFYGTPELTTRSGDDFEVVVSSETVTNEIPDEFAVEQNYPNPFNPTTQIRYEIAEETHVRVEVFNSLGQHVANLVDANRSPGVYEVTFDGSNLTSGTYIFRIEAGDYVQSRQMMLVK